jgi:hypothetical protein
MIVDVGKTIVFCPRAFAGGVLGLLEGFTAGLEVRMDSKRCLKPSFHDQHFSSL